MQGWSGGSDLEESTEGTTSMHRVCMRQLGHNIVPNSSQAFEASRLATTETANGHSAHLHWIIVCLGVYMECICPMQAQHCGQFEGMEMRMMCGCR